MNSAIAEKIRDEACSMCKMNRGAKVICEIGSGPSTAKVMVVSKMPNSQKYQDLINDELSEAGIESGEVYHTSAIKCRSWEGNPSRADIKACKVYLDEEIDIVKPEFILLLGNEALSSVTGHSGIMAYKGRPLTRDRATIIPTISPGAVLRNPGQRESFRGDLRFFAAQVYEKSSSVPPPKIKIIDTPKKLEKLKQKLSEAQLISYDVETTRAGEFEENAAIISLAGTLVMNDGSLYIFAIPLFHPQSAFERVWERVLQALAKYLAKPKKQIAHNGKFDARWLRQFGVPVRVTFDTMLAAHLLDENRQKGLKPQGTSRLGVAPWGIDTASLLDTPIEEVLEYNALDTYYTYHIYLQMREELLAQPRLAKIFQRITMPANEILIEVERRGIWVDREALATALNVATKMVESETQKLMKYVPQGTPEELAGAGWPHRVLKTRGVRLNDINFNASNWARWWLFDHLGLPVLATGKEKDDGREGDPSMAEAVMLELKPMHPAVAIHLERSRWVKILQFLSSYDEVMTEDDRIHTTFKLAGTVTGRLSSGKADQDKVTGRKVDIKGINLQQIPRDPFVRGLFGASPT